MSETPKTVKPYMKGKECENCDIRDTNVEKDIDQASHTGSVYITNNWSSYPLKRLFIRHRMDNRVDDTDSIELFDVQPYKDSLKVMEFRYFTGSGSPYDYWYIEFTNNKDEKFKIKDNFYCSVSSSDNGNVYLDLRPEKVKELHISFSQSSSCWVNILPQ